MNLKFRFEQETHSVVVLGDFNPKIFHPDWFSSNGLLPPQLTDEASSPLYVSRELTTFVVDDIHIQVEQSRLGLTTKNPAKFPAVKDLALGCLQLLEHTPLKALGLNLDFEKDMETADSWHAVGDGLAPKEPWRDLLQKPGLNTIVMEGQRAGCAADRVHIKVKPSPLSQYAVYVGINQHYDLDGPEQKSVRHRNREAQRILTDDWNSFRQYAGQCASILVQQQISN